MRYQSFNNKIHKKPAEKKVFDIFKKPKKVFSASGKINIIQTNHATHKKNDDIFLKKKKKKMLFNFLKVFGFIFSVLFVFWIFLLSNAFSIKEILINGTDNSYAKSRIEEILKIQESKKNVLLKQKNIFIFNDFDFKSAILSEFENLFNSVSIAKSYPNKISVDIKERLPAIILINIRSKFMLDEEGYLIRNLEREPIPTMISYGYGKAISYGNYGYSNASYADNKVSPIKLNIPTIFLNDGSDIKTGSFSKEKIRFVLNILNKLPKESIAIKQIKIDTIDDSKVIVSTQKGFDIYFNMENDLDEQIGYLRVVIKDKIQDKINQIQYIDLRFGSKIYYK